MARGVLVSGKRHVGKPTGVRSAVGEETPVKEEAAREIEPVAEGVQTRVGDVARADHQRHQVDSQAHHHRHCEEEHHRRAVHREELVIEIGIEESVLGARELEAHRQSLEASQEKEDERGHNVALADRLVIDAREESQPAGLFGPGAFEFGVLLLLGIGGTMPRLRSAGAHWRLPR